MTAITPSTLTPWDVTLAGYQHWRTTLGGFSQATWDGERATLTGFAQWMQARGVEGPMHASRTLTQEWWAQGKSQWQESTQHTKLHQLRKFLWYCRAEGWMTHDPAMLLGARKPQPQDRNRLDAEELVILLDYARNPRDRIVIALCSNLGLRAGELKRLQVKDVDAPYLRVQVDKTLETDRMGMTPELRLELDHWLDELEAGSIRGQHVGRESYLVASHYYDNRNGRWLWRPQKPLGDPEDVLQDALLRACLDGAITGGKWLEPTEDGPRVIPGEGIHTIRRSAARQFYEHIKAEHGKDDALVATMEFLHHDRVQTTLTYIGLDHFKDIRDDVLLNGAFLPRRAGITRRLRSVT